MTEGFILLARNRSDDSPVVRIGFTVTKKIGGAVVRNRLKRRLRAAARHVFSETPPPGHDFVLIGRTGGLSRAFADLAADLGRAVRKSAS